MLYFLSGLPASEKQQQSPKLLPNIKWIMKKSSVYYCRYLSDCATEQLQVYANILDAPMSIVYSKEELNEAIEKYAEYDLVFVDTAGFSHKNEEQKEDIRNLIQGVSPEYTSEVYLVLSATTKYRDLLDIVDTYRTISEFKLIFTKLDETSTYGNLLNIKLYSDAELSYTTNGQNVPDDIELFDTQKIVKQLLGGNS